MTAYRRKKAEVVEAVTFDEFVEVGRKQLGCTDMPWSFDYRGTPVTHETDDMYVVGNVHFRRGQILVTPLGPPGPPTPWDADAFAKTFVLEDGTQVLVCGDPGGGNHLLAGRPPRLGPGVSREGQP